MGRGIAMVSQRWPALIDYPVRAQVTTVCDINPVAMEWFDQIPTGTANVTNLTAVRICWQRSPLEGIALRPRISWPRRAHPDSFVRCSSEIPIFPGAQQAINAIRSGLLCRIIDVRSSFLHSSDLDRQNGINWKRQAAS